MTWGVFDIEANDWTTFVALGAKSHIGEYCLFESVKEFLAYCERSDCSLWYAHNGGRYDFLFLMEKLAGKNITVVERGGRIMEISWKLDKGRVIRFRDSYLLFRASLESLIQTFEVSHKKIPVDFRKHFTIEDVREHLENDVLALYDVLNQGFEKYGITGDLTISSFAMRKFQDTGKAGLLVKENRECSRDLRRWFYHGGRVEVFKKYATNVHCYDINSLYPYAMIGYFPIGKAEYVSKADLRSCGFYSVQVDKDSKAFEICSPFVATSEKNGLYYPSGVGRFLCSTHELKELKRNKIPFVVEFGWEWQSKARVFDEFVNYYYALKSNSTDSSERYIAKCILNHLYGKFGQGEVGQVFKTNFPDFGDSDEIFDAVDKFYVRKKPIFSGNTKVYVASWITATARNIHYQLMKKIGFERIVYCDTDSIHVDGEIDSSLVSDTVLGALKFEGRWDEGVYVAPKVYALRRGVEEQVKVKGFDSDDFTYADFSLFNAMGVPLATYRERLISFREMIRGNKKFSLKGEVKRIQGGVAKRNYVSERLSHTLKNGDLK